MNKFKLSNNIKKSIIGKKVTTRGKKPYASPNLTAFAGLRTQTMGASQGVGESDPGGPRFPD